MEAVLPWLICGTCVLFFAVYGLVAGGKADSASDRFLTGGRSFGSLVVGFSMFATGNTGFMFSGAIGTGYTQGLSAIWLPIAWFLGELAFWLWLPTRINDAARERNAVSIPDYIATSAPTSERRRVRRLAGAIVMFGMAPLVIGQSIAAGKAVAVVSSIDSVAAVLIGGGCATLVALLYCMRGGLRASILANAVQGAVILSVSVLLLFVIVASLGGTESAIERIQVENPQTLELFDVSPGLAFLAFMLGGATAAFGSTMGLPTILMRMAAARDGRTLRRTRWWYLLITYGFWILMCLFGVLMVAAVPDVSDPEQSLFHFARAQSPWLLGIVLAGIAALILSTIDGSLMVGGSALSDDIAEAGASSAARARVIRLASLVLFAGGTLAAAAYLSTSSVFEIVLFGLSAMSGGIGPAFLVATLNWRTNSKALGFAMMTGILVAVTWAAAGLTHLTSEALPAFASGLLVHWLVATTRTRTIATSV